jgi:tyrosinase
MFLPWHRQLLLMFEDALRAVTRTAVTVPYWDWTDPRSTASVFAEDFMGGDGDPDQDYAVTTGPFRKGTWQLTVHPEGLEWSGSATPYVTRRIGTFSGIALPTEAELEPLLATPLYDVRPFDDRSDPERSFRSGLEGWPRRLPTGEVICAPDGWVVAFPVVAGHEMHNAVHLWAGGNTAQSGAGIRLGTMAVVPTSPNDPVFWLNHANVDRLWAQWQERHGVDTYEPRAGVARNSSDDVIRPFDSYGVAVTPRDVADIDALGYRYSAAAAPSSVDGAGTAQAAASGKPSARWQSFGCRFDGQRSAEQASGLEPAGAIPAGR